MIRALSRPNRSVKMPAEREKQVQNMTEKRRNTALLAAWLVTPAAFLINLVYFFLQFPGEWLLPWVNLAVFILALALCVTALRRAFGQPEVYRGKIAGSIITVLACLLFAFTIFVFRVARQMPETAQAPQEGQKISEFTLTDTGGNPVTLSSLMNGPLPKSPRPDGRPKAVLLVFYRGYW